MRKILTISLLTVVMSFYIFPVSFTFLPFFLNSKMIIAGFGVAAFAFDSVRKSSLEVSNFTLISGLFAVVFSLWCLFCIVFNGSTDTSYATYIVSFLTWLFGAYGVCVFLRMENGGPAGIATITRYLAFAGVFQCIAAVLIDNYTGISNFVDRFFDMGQNFYKMGGRLYGIGAALDPGGIRFSVILVMIAQQFYVNAKSGESNIYQPVNLVSFSIITIIGAVISRTTLVGAGLGLAYMVVSMLQLRKGGFITTRTLQLYMIFVSVIVAIFAFIFYFYIHSSTFHGYLRFGFEAFFNWMETGEFRTNSTDHLSTMWIWPTDALTWLIGRGTFGVFDNFTDIGYCNFIFYCGLIGLLIFSFYFIYTHLSMNGKFNDFRICSWMLVALTFIVWVKVTTDIFFIDALLLCALPDKIADK